MNLFWWMSRVLLVILVGIGLASAWGVPALVIASGYLLGCAHMHMAHLSETHTEREPSE